MQQTYKILFVLATPLIWLYLQYRAFQGKEIKSRLNEKYGKASLSRPKAPLIWIHAASVGEAQSALLLINRLSKNNPNHKFLVTSVTVTSASMLKKNLPLNAFHQFVPIDHPVWVERFLNHWKPELALFMESEIWPNIIYALKKKNITTLIINARLSEKSFKGWKRIKDVAKDLFSSFDLILTQTKTDTDHYTELGGNAKTAGNIKLNAAMLPFHEGDLNAFEKSIKDRPVWVYASTHEGEEELAAQTHIDLKETFPNLLTIIVPRHPVRSSIIVDKLKPMGVNITTRTAEKILPNEKTDIYLVNTLGELGLFYRVAPISMIGRSFSFDGGGGHNPIEAAQLGSIVLTGPHIQFQKNLFNPMFLEEAAFQIHEKPELAETINMLLSNNVALKEAQSNIENFINGLDDIIENVVTNIQKHIKNDLKDAA